MIDLGELKPSKYMDTIINYGNSEKRKTPIYEVYERNGSNRLGDIRWYPAWRGFCFFPNNNTVFDHGCLLKIVEWINELNKRYKEASE